MSFPAKRDAAMRPVQGEPLSVTKQQQEVVNCPSPRLIVEANAGAAKTTTAALRVREQLRRGTNPWQILLLAYTQPGCLALELALRKIGVPSRVVKQLRIHTFNDFCSDRLRVLEGPVPRLRTAERVKPHVLAAVRRARTKVNERHASEFQLEGDGELAVEGLLAAFHHIKGTMQLLHCADGFAPSPASADELGLDFSALTVFLSYERLRWGALWRDSDGPVFRFEGDATYDMAALLSSDEPPGADTAHPLALDLQLIVVDEMHDVNRAMFTVLRGLLAMNSQTAFVGVGDMDQVIHASAGADVYFMREGFDIEAGSAVRLPLGASFRFGIDTARMLGGFSGKAYASLCRWQSRVDIRPASSAVDLRLEISHALQHRPGLAPRSPQSELAVLLRHPSRAVDLENELLDHGIDYVPVGFESYLRRPEVLFIRGVLACALNVFSDVVDTDDARRAVIHATMLFVGQSVVTTLDGVDDDRLAKERETVARLSTGADFQTHVMPDLLAKANTRVRQQIFDAMILARSNRTEDLPQICKVLDVSRLASRLLVHATAVSAVSDSVRGLVAAAGKFETIERFLYGTNERELRLNGLHIKERCIRLSTIEAAKGLEFDHVIVPDVDVRDFDGVDRDERNLFYVAASRARHLLTITHKPGRPSSYLQVNGAAQEPTSAHA